MFVPQGEEPTIQPIRVQEAAQRNKRSRHTCEPCDKVIIGDLEWTGTAPSVASFLKLDFSPSNFHTFFGLSPAYQQLTQRRPPCCLPHLQLTSSPKSITATSGRRGGRTNRWPPPRRPLLHRRPLTASPPLPPLRALLIGGARTQKSRRPADSRSGWLFPFGPPRLRSPRSR